MNTQMQKEFDRLEHAIGDGDPKRLRQAVDELRDATKVLSSANDTQVGGQRFVPSIYIADEVRKPACVRVVITEFQPPGDATL